MKTTEEIAEDTRECANVSFKDISYRDNMLRVYEDGRIYKLPYIDKRGARRSGKFLSTRPDKDGYQMTTLRYGSANHNCKTHRIIAKAFCDDYSENLQVDHINGDKTDNRSENIRMTNNMGNARSFQNLRGGSSKYRGVTWDARKNKWMASLGLKSGTKFFGYFDDERNAAIAVNIGMKIMDFSDEALNKIA